MTQQPWGAIDATVDRADGSRPASFCRESGRLAGTSRGARNERAQKKGVSGVCGAFLAAAALLAVPASAGARTIQQDLDVAHRYWNTEICRGEWRAVPNRTLLSTLQIGARTWMRDCLFEYDPALPACDRENAVLHEVGHFVHGRAHAGPMAHAVLDDVPCVGERLRQARVKARWLRARQ